jgi:hypothetical protein
MGSTLDEGNAARVRYFPRHSLGALIRGGHVRRSMDGEHGYHDLVKTIIEFIE